MMYQDKFVVVVKCNGKILREQGDIVQLPFGSEYSILLKNLSTKRAVAKIEIDGREVTDGGIVVDANTDVELERFIDSGDLQKGYKFRFIQKTKEVQEYRGDKVDDGFIRVEWQYEREPLINWTYNKSTMRSGSSRTIRGSGANFGYNTNTGSGYSGSEVFTCSAGLLGRSIDVVADSLNDSPLNDEGITVEGSDSNQRFKTVYVGELESEHHAIILKLVGTTCENTPIKVPAYVKTTVRCNQCGAIHPITANYCSRCSARLIK